MTSEEKKTLDRMNEDLYNEVRLAAEAHRQVSVHTFLLRISLLLSSSLIYMISVAFVHLSVLAVAYFTVTMLR